MANLLNSISGSQLIFLCGMLLLGMMLLKRTAKRLRTSQQRNPLAEIQNETRQREMHQQNRIQQMEIRLHEFSREVESRIQTRIAVLDEMTRQTDEKIHKLEVLLNALQNGDGNSRNYPNHPMNDQIEQQLNIAGYSPKEVSHILGHVSVEMNNHSGSSEMNDAA